MRHQTYKINYVRNLLIQVSEHLSLLEKEHPNIKLELYYEIINTGIAPKLFPTTDAWEEWEDFGGRVIKIEFEIPNYKKPETKK